MSRSRTFTFLILKYEEPDWEFICNFKENQGCEYIVSNIENDKINGFVRFLNAKTIKAVEKLFKAKAIIKIEFNNDNYHRERYSTYNKWFEAGKCAKNQKRESENLLKIIEKDKKINELVSEKETITNQFVEHQNNVISGLLKLKENEPEQLKQLVAMFMDFVKQNPTTIINSNPVNNSNSKFNLNFFLNEKCKDAMNIFDFVKGIQFNLQDILLFSKVGHVEAMTQIFDKAYKNMDLTMRPIHCTDIKRETLYVRNENEWCNDESRKISEKAIDILSNKSFLNMKKWREANPEYESSSEKKSEYEILVKNILSNSSNYEEAQNMKKIIKNISINTQLNKERALAI